jgi:regulatory protein
MSSNLPGLPCRPAWAAIGRFEGDGVRKEPKRITESRLRHVAAWYLERYDASRKRLLDVLLRRVRRSAAFHGEDEGPWREMAERVADSLCALGLVDDARHARETARQMRERGKSELHIRLALRQRGIASDLITAALAGDPDDDDGDGDASPDRVAAARYVRRRGLGPCRRPSPSGAPADPDRHRKDVATLARAGFSFDDARAVLALSRDEVEALALGGLGRGP